MPLLMAYLNGWFREMECYSKVADCCSFNDRSDIKAASNTLTRGKDARSSAQIHQLGRATNTKSLTFLDTDD
jgi:hypothetical protein